MWRLTLLERRDFVTRDLTNYLQRRLTDEIRDAVKLLRYPQDIIPLDLEKLVEDIDLEKIVQEEKLRIKRDKAQYWYCEDYYRTFGKDPDFKF